MRVWASLNSRDFVTGPLEPVAQGGDMGGADLAAASDYMGAGLDPADGLTGIGLGVEVVAGMQRLGDERRMGTSGRGPGFKESVRGPSREPVSVPGHAQRDDPWVP